MLKACKYCGRIHDSNYNCGKKPKQNKWKNQDKFRSSALWQSKRKQIKERDYNLCRLSLYFDKKIVTVGLSVHHIEPLEEAYGRRLDDDNLITLCSYYHELAEAGKIDKKLLHRLAASPPTFEGEKEKTLHTNS